MNHLNSIRKIAWSFHRTTGLDWDELFAEASLAYCEARQRYQPGRVTEITWIVNYVKMRLTDYLRRERKHQMLFQRVESYEFIPDSNSIFYVSIFDDAPAEVREVINVVLSAPEEFADLPPKLARGRVRRTLHTRGWSTAAAWNAIRNTKDFINETSRRSYNISRQPQTCST